MSEMSMFMHGIGLEAFEDKPEDVYQRVEVETDELATMSRQLDLVRGELTDQASRVTALVDARDYATANREGLTEDVAEELRRRVMAVVGEERAMLIVGSVESYNGPIASHMLNAGLESIGSFLRSALEALIKLIRTGAKILMNFFASARVVLSNQLRAISALSAATNKKVEGWDEMMLDIGKANTQKAASPVYDIPESKPAYVQPTNKPKKTSLSPRAFDALALNVSGQLIVSSEFSYMLSRTCDTVTGIGLDLVSGFNKQYTAVLDLFGEADKFKDGVEVFSALLQLSMDKFIPLNRLKPLKQESTETLSVMASAPMMGDVRFVLACRPEALYASKATMSGNRTNFIVGLSFPRFDLEKENGYAFPSANQVRALSRLEATRSLKLIDDLVKTMIDNPLQAQASALSRQADKIASTTLANLRIDEHDYAMKEFQRNAVGVMSGLTNLTAAGPRMLIGYVNNLASAVREYVELSGDFN